MDPAGIGAACGPGWCREYSGKIDAALSGWLADHVPPRPVAVVALGSYALRELCPSSDVDVLLLHDGWPSQALADLVSALCYPLWDAGLEVGHAVHTPRSAVVAAAGDLETATALTCRRFVAGDQGLADALGGRVGTWLKRNTAAFVSGVRAADLQRHAAAGATPGMLEPHLKDGAGGLRDIASLRWGAAALLGEPTLDALVGARYVGAVDRHRLADAGTTLLSARCALHLVGGSQGSDVLRLDLQDDAARLAGWKDGDDMLRQVGLAMRSVAHVHERTWTRLLDDATRGRGRRKPPPTRLADGVRRVDGLVEIEEGRRPDAEPALAVRAVTIAAARDTQLGRSTGERLARALAGTELDWDGDTRAAFLDLLRRGQRAPHALADADHVGLLAALLPEWPRVRGRPQRNPLHTFDLDTHGARTLAELARLTSEEPYASIAAELGDRDALPLAAWLHDVGKAWPGDHSEVGAVVARRWLEHAGFERALADRVAHLVLHHLLLPDVATRRDLDDEDEIVAVAERAGSVDAVDALYLLALADGRATGPTASSPWRERLVGELHGRVRRLLAEDTDALRKLLDPQVVVSEARRLAGAGEAAGVTERDLDALLDGLPRRYLLAASPEQCLAHAALYAAHLADGAPHVSVRPAQGGTAVASLTARDRPGLVADGAGTLAAAGAVVHEARAYTKGSVALDWFVVRVEPGTDVERLARELTAAIGGAFHVARAVASRERRREHRPPRLARPVRVEVVIEEQPHQTRVEVSAPDTPGLLWRLARVLAASGLDLSGARVATLGPAARDVFFLRPAPLPADLEQRIRAAVDGE
jgi:[protein-PII] uridylyltransferase